MINAVYVKCLLLIFLVARSDCYSTRTYKPTWAELDSRPIPKWYHDSKIGILIHWGVYSVPGLVSEWFWEKWIGGHPKISDFMGHYYPSSTYQDFASMFTAEFFDPGQWAKIFKKSGAKYVVLTAKHHDGFTLYPSLRSFNWNSVQVGPRRDIVGELTDAIRREGIAFGVYYSLYEWFNPLYLEDKKAQFTSKSYTLQKVWPDIRQLVEDYLPSVLWVDGDWEANDNYWKSQELLAWLYNESPVRNEIVVNDRWGTDRNLHGGFHTGHDRFSPSILLGHKFETSIPLDQHSWGFRKNMELSDVVDTMGFLKEIITTVSCGGNVLINIGPTQHGTISPIFVERLMTLGDWLDTNGRAIYETSPWFYQSDSENGDVWYTCRTYTYNEKNPIARPASEADVMEVYAIILEYPIDNILRLKNISKYIKENTETRLFGFTKKLRPVTREDNGVTEIKLPYIQTVSSNYAWVVQFKDKNNSGFRNQSAHFNYIF